MTRIIHIAGNSGSGKTILSLNLALALASKGKSTVLIDANIYSPEIAHYSDISPQFFLNEFLNNDRNIEEVMLAHPTGLKIIPSIKIDEYDKEYHSKINKALISLVGKAEIVLVDSFSHNSALTTILDRTDETIFMTNDDLHSIYKSKEFIEDLEEKGMHVSGIVLNRKRKSTKIKDVESMLNKKVLATLAHDDRIIDSINTRKPFIHKYPYSDSAKSINELAELLNV